MARVKYIGEPKYYNGETRTGWFDMNDAEAHMLGILGVVEIRPAAEVATEPATAVPPDPAPEPEPVAEAQAVPEPEVPVAAALSHTAVEPMKTSPVLTRTK
jgi:hypothetical protein